jgi:Recombinase zinc beta ribbon domain
VAAAAAENGAVGRRAVRPGVAGHHPIDLDPVRGEAGEGEGPGCALPALVGHLDDDGPPDPVVDDQERKAHTFHATEWKQGPHEPLWSEALWASIQAVRQRAFRGSNGGKIHNVYPFRRLAVCDRCGARLYGEAQRSKTAREPVLSMACTTQRERHDCAQRGVRSARLEDQVGEWLATLVIPDDWRADIERLQRREAQIERPAVDTTRIERQLANLRDLFAEADSTREEYIGRKRA